MATFKLKYERYVQEAAWVEVKADSLAEAMAMAWELDSDELDWEEECLVEGERLYGVVEGPIEEDNWVAKVNLEHVLGAITWFNEDLRQQWGDTEFEARQKRARKFARDEINEWDAAEDRKDRSLRIAEGQSA